MAQYTAYANYVIFFSDPTEYAAAIATCGGAGYMHCPSSAAAQFGLPWPPVTTPLEGQTNGMFGLEPWGIPVGAPGRQVYHPTASGTYLRGEVDSVLVPGQIGTGGSSAGPDMLLKWIGNIILVNAQVGGSASPPLADIPPRRFIGGYEISGVVAEGGSGLAGSEGSRDSSRLLDGRGLPIRGPNAIPEKLRYQNEFNPSLNARTTWERFYIRIRNLGTNECGIWRCGGSATPANGAAIRVSTAGKILAYNVGLAPDLLIGTSTATLALNKWYLVDTLIRYSDGAIHGKLRIYINHTLDITANVTTGDGIDATGYHTLSKLGQHTTPETDWEIDLDTWIGADVPNIGGVESLTSIDWLTGSHVRVVNVLSGTVTNYTGDVQSANQHFNPGSATAYGQFNSTTAVATIEGLTDRVDLQDALGINYGAAAFLLGVYSYSAAGTGQLGYKLAGAATVWNSITANEAAVFRWGNYLYGPSGVNLPSTIAPFSILKKKSNDANQNIIYALTAVIEDIGAWGHEDDSSCVDNSNTNKLLHNCRYPSTTYSFLGGVPTAPTLAMGGTYVGTGTHVDVNLPSMPHFLFIRGLTGASYPITWFATGMGGHRNGAEMFPPDHIVRVYVDSTGQAKFTVVGTDANANANGVTYQYVAFCDPGMRFNYCGAFNKRNALASYTHSLWVTNFLAQFGFIQKDVLSSATTTAELAFKGLGHGANDGSIISGAAIANWGSFAAGALTTLANFHTSHYGQYNYSLWRTTEPISGYVAVQLFTYTGDGSGSSRVISMPLTTGRYPLLVFVLPHNSTVGYWRDPSHTGSNSSPLNAATVDTTHIIAGGIDSITVATGALNTTGIVYDVFCIMGDSAGFNNGTFYVPNYLAAGTWPTPTYAPPEDRSGIYTLIPERTHDMYYDRGTGVEVDVKINDPYFKTGYIGG